MSYGYSSKYGLQKGSHREAGNLAVMEHLISRLRDKVGKIQVRWGETYATLDLIEKYVLEYPEDMIDPPQIAFTFIAESYKEPGIGRVMVDGYGEEIGFTKIMQLQIDIWARKNIERAMISDAILECIHTSWRFFRRVGIRDLKHISSRDWNYDQERSTLFQRVYLQTGSRLYRRTLIVEVEYDLVSVPPSEEDGDIIERIILDQDIIDGGVAISTIGGLTDLILDSRFVLVEQLEGAELW